MVLEVKVLPRVVMVVLNAGGDPTIRFPVASWARRSTNALRARPGVAMRRRNIDAVLFFPNHFVVAMADDYLRWRCPHCKGSGIAPGDGQTECGFCDHGIYRRPSWSKFAR